MVERENKAWGLHLCEFEEICSPLDTEGERKLVRAGGIDSPNLGNCWVIYKLGNRFLEWLQG